MSILEELLQKEDWMEFYEGKRASGNWSETELKELDSFIETEAYRPIVEKMLRGEAFAPPQKNLLGKIGTTKKRTVYRYPYEENMVLKLLAGKLHRYDRLFSPNLYSFRSGHGVREALDHLSQENRKQALYSYKLDIRNYFNSIPVESLLAMCREKLEDPGLYRFLAAYLGTTYAEYEGRLIEEEKGVMAGTPISPFLANLYLSDMDEAFADVLYARYSDDIILFAESEEERERLASRLQDMLREKGLSVNPEKEIRTAPEEPWTFLGICVGREKTDIAPVSKQKLKDKLRRRARSLERWKRRKGVTGAQAARAYIRAVNRKLYENPNRTELTWTRWYFPLINTDTSLKELDQYIQMCIRYVYFGNHGKKTYRLRYEELKELGYRSLVHAYWEEA